MALKTKGGPITLEREHLYIVTLKKWKITV